jgi:preprotein translocase subunit SecE
MDIPARSKLVSPATFVREVIAELKKVTWPTKAETLKLTVVVIAISVIVGIFIGILDTTFLRITALIFGR